MSGVKPEYAEVWTGDHIMRQTHDAGREANRKMAIAVNDMRGEPVRSSSSINAKFGQTILADTTSNQVNVALPSAVPDDIGRRVTIKLWAGTPGNFVLIAAPNGGRIDGNQWWRLNQAMESATIEYFGNNDWGIVASVPGVGGLVVTGIVPITLP